MANPEINGSGSWGGLGLRGIEQALREQTQRLAMPEYQYPPDIYAAFDSYLSSLKAHLATRPSDEVSVGSAVMNYTTGQGYIEYFIKGVQMIYPLTADGFPPDLEALVEGAMPKDLWDKQLEFAALNPSF